jgi:hypothetical protein
MNLWEMGDLRLPWCLRTVVTLRIAEHLNSADAGIGELAAAAGCDPQALRGVLEFLVSKGIFEEPEEDRFHLNDAARGLLEPAVRLGLDLNGIGGRMAGAWATLPGYVRTGEPAYHEAFGVPFWQDLDAHPDIAASFDALIGPGGHGDFNGSFELTRGWDEIRTVVDVGGGTGAMLAAILQLHPQVSGVLVDLPRTVARAAATFRAHGLEDRVTTAGQSFFDPLPAGGDVYLLRGVLNNWADREAEALLRRCADAAGREGRVVILKSIGPDGSRPGISESDVMAGGKHRSVTEFRKLAQQSGLEVVSAGKQPSGYFVVECGIA